MPALCQAGVRARIAAAFASGYNGPAAERRGLLREDFKRGAEMVWSYAIRLLPWAMWRKEIQAIEPYLSGRGADIGCGRRKARAGAVGIDLFPYPGVDIIADASALPLRSASLHYVCSVHSLEHCRDPQGTLVEWLRVLCDGGSVCLVLPDVRYTGEANTDRTPHWQHWTLPGFLSWLGEAGLAGLVHTAGEACPRWSFFVVLRKTSSPRTTAVH